MYEERVDGVADAVAPRLRVIHQRNRHLEVGVGVDIHLHDGLTVSADGHRRVGANVVDELGAPAGHDDVDEVVELQQIIDQGPVGVGDDLYGVGRNLGFGERLLNQRAEGRVTVSRLFAAAKDGCVPALQCQGSDVDGHVGPGLVDAGNDAQGHAPPPDQQPVRKRASVEHLADRVWQRSNVARVVRDRDEPRWRECEPLDEVFVHAMLARGLEVECICLEHRCLFGFQQPGDSPESGVFLGRRKHREAPRSGACGRREFTDGGSSRGRHLSSVTSLRPS